MSCLLLVLTPPCPDVCCAYRIIIALHSIVLENLSYPFLKPNILDVKLGTLLYDEDASPEKKERMDKAARDTTTHETGIRLTGFQVCVIINFLLTPLITTTYV